MADTYFDKANRHEVYIQRLATQLLNDEVYKSLGASYKAARAILLDAEELKTLPQVNRITRAIEREIVPATNAMWSDVTEQLDEFAVYEAGFSAKMLGEVAGVALAVPADKKVLSYINQSLMSLSSGQQVQAGAWSEFTRKNARSIATVYDNQIKAGFAGGETVNQIAKRLRNITEGLLKRNAEALTRTGISHYAIGARDAMAQDNKDVITGKYYNAVFDNRTTLTCRGHADDPKNPWALDDDSAPTIPAHWNCRSNWLFMVNGQDRPEGTKAAVGGRKGEKAAERYNRRKDALDARRGNPDIDGKTSSKVKYRGRKDSDTFKAGQISGATTADSFLRQQPRWFIESALGKERAKLFIDKGVNITQFTDMTGRKLTLKELIDSGV